MAFHDISGEFKNPVLQVVFKKTTTPVSYSNAAAQDYVVLNSDSVTVTSGTTLLCIANYQWWMQDDDNPTSYHGRQYLQYEINGGSWADARSASTATFENSISSAYLNNRGEITTLNAFFTHGQSTGTTIKFRIVHRSVQPSSCDLLVFQRNSNETNMTIMEVGA